MKKTFITTIANNGDAPVSVRASTIREVRLAKQFSGKIELGLVVAADKTYLYDTYPDMDSAETYRNVILNMIG